MPPSLILHARNLKDRISAQCATPILFVRLLESLAINQSLGLLIAKAFLLPENFSFFLNGKEIDISLESAVAQFDQWYCFSPDNKSWLALGVESARSVPITDKILLGVLEMASLSSNKGIVQSNIIHNTIDGQPISHASIDKLVALGLLVKRTAVSCFSVDRLQWERIKTQVVIHAKSFSLFFESTLRFAIDESNKRLLFVNVIRLIRWANLDWITVSRMGTMLGISSRNMENFVFETVTFTKNNVGELVCFRMASSVDDEVWCLGLLSMTTVDKKFESKRLFTCYRLRNLPLYQQVACVINASDAGVSSTDIRRITAVSAKFATTISSQFSSCFAYPCRKIQDGKQIRYKIARKKEENAFIGINDFFINTAAIGNDVRDCGQSYLCDSSSQSDRQIDRVNIVWKKLVSCRGICLYDNLVDAVRRYDVNSTVDKMTLRRTFDWLVNKNAIRIHHVNTKISLSNGCRQVSLIDIHSDPAAVSLLDMTAVNESLCADSRNVVVLLVTTSYLANNQEAIQSFVDGYIAEQQKSVNVMKLVAQQHQQSTSTGILQSIRHANNNSGRDKIVHQTHVNNKKRTSTRISMLSEQLSPPLEIEDKTIATAASVSILVDGNEMANTGHSDVHTSNDSQQQQRAAAATVAVRKRPRHIAAPILARDVATTFSTTDELVKDHQSGSTNIFADKPEGQELMRMLEVFLVAFVHGPLVTHSVRQVFFPTILLPFYPLPYKDTSLTLSINHNSALFNSCILTTDLTLIYYGIIYRNIGKSTIPRRKQCCQLLHSIVTIRNLILFLLLGEYNFQPRNSTFSIIKTILHSSCQQPSPSVGGTHPLNPRINDTRKSILTHIIQGISNTYHTASDLLGEVLTKYPFSVIGEVVKDLYAMGYIRGRSVASNVNFSSSDKTGNRDENNFTTIQFTSLYVNAFCSHNFSPYFFIAMTHYWGPNDVCLDLPYDSTKNDRSLDKTATPPNPCSVNISTFDILSALELLCKFHSRVAFNIWVQIDSVDISDPSNAPSNNNIGIYHCRSRSSSFARGPEEEMGVVGTDEAAAAAAAITATAAVISQSAPSTASNNALQRICVGTVRTPSRSNALSLRLLYGVAVHPSIAVSSCINSATGAATALDAVILDTDVTTCLFTAASFGDTDELSKSFVRQSRLCFATDSMHRREEDVCLVVDWLIYRVGMAGTTGVTYADLRTACQTMLLDRSSWTAAAVGATRDIAHHISSSDVAHSESERLLLQSIAVAIEMKSICFSRSVRYRSHVVSSDSSVRCEAEDDNVQNLITSVMHACLISTRFAILNSVQSDEAVNRCIGDTETVPWIHLDGTVNSSALAMYSARVFNCLAECPGMNFSSIHSMLSPLFSEQQTEVLLKLLVDQGMLMTEVPSCSVLIQDSAIWSDFAFDVQHTCRTTECYFIFI